MPLCNANQRLLEIHYFEAMKCTSFEAYELLS